ncbi:glutamate 5-kinase [Helicobacter sp. T3_23-1056]
MANFSDLKQASDLKIASDSTQASVSKIASDSKRVGIANCKTLIIKIGSQILASQNPSSDLSKSNSFPNQDFIASLARQIATLKKQIPNIIIVSSGAVACGFKQLGLKERPKDIIDKQASAAIGQARLMWEYQHAFSKYDLQVAQILLTKDDLTSRKRFTHAHSCIMRLLHFGAIPIINENDTILVDELKYIETFGDNDNLASLLAGTIDADLLLILSDVDGLYSANPATNPNATKIDEVKEINDEILSLARTSGAKISTAKFDKTKLGRAKLGTGGMASKLIATRQAISMGCAVAIIKGNENEVILRFFAGENLGTYFPLPNEILSRKKKRFWIESVAITQGQILIDSGAFSAIKNHKSLLPKGILGVVGEFGSGDVVSICVSQDEQIREIARGQSKYSASEVAKIAGSDSAKIAKILGKSRGDEVVHIDELVLLA